VSAFDPAALSRVTLAVKFTPLGKDGMEQIWRNTIARVLCSDATRSLTYEVALKEADEKFDLSKLSSFPGSGRSVGAVMKMAIALCIYRQCDLTETILQECIDNFLSFHNDLKNEGAPEDWDDK
jgi:ATP-dependent Clp protease ATP-binding subunit ClpA